jgi:HEAT repeat protein
VKSSPFRLLPAAALALAAALLVTPLARAQAADEAAPAQLGPWSWESTPSHLRIAAALREARHASPNDGALLQQRIAESGRDAVAAQVDILLRGRVPETNPKDGPQILSEKQRDLLLGALAHMPLEAVRKELDARLSKTPDDKGACLGAIYALGVVGQAKDIAQLVALAPRKPDSQELALPYSSREALRSSVATLLRRDPRAWPALASALREVDLNAARVLLDALACARDPRALGILLETARTNHKLAWKAASLVPACGSSLNAQTDRDFLEWVRSEIQNASPDYARTLLMAVGTLDDGDWVPALIERLEDEDSGIREEALSALRRISGLGFPGDPASWRTWYATETRWHAEQRPQLVRQLSSAETPKVICAIREYSEHRTRRAELAEELVKVLEHGKPEVRGLAISVLERLGSPAACGALLGMLGDGNTKVREAAWQALHTISGLEIPHDPDQLRELFGRS